MKLIQHVARHPRLYSYGAVPVVIGLLYLGVPIPVWLALALLMPAMIYFIEDFGFTIVWP